MAQTAGDINTDFMLLNSDVHGNINGHDCYITGSVKGDINGDNCVVDGNLVGDIHGDHCVVNGSVTGDVYGNNYEVRGQISGCIYGRIDKPAKNKGYDVVSRFLPGSETKTDIIIGDIFNSASQYNTIIDKFTGRHDRSILDSLYLRKYMDSINPARSQLPPSSGEYISKLITPSGQVRDIYSTTTTHVVDLTIDDVNDNIQYFANNAQSRPTDEKSSSKQDIAQKAPLQIPLYDCSKDNVSTNEENELCVICMENKRQCIFIPCGHYSTCIRCVHAIHNKENDTIKCSLCNTMVTLVQKVF